MDIPLADIAPLDRPKAEVARQRFQLREVHDTSSHEFHAAYDMLASYFLDQGELEEREVLAGFVRQRILTYGEGVDGTYHLLTAWDGDQLAGVRDCYVEIDRRVPVCLVSLAHAYVAPPWRRTGLAALFRALPVTLARTVLDERLGHSLPAMVVAEMEPADPEHPETVVRLLAYGRSGFSVLDPRRVPYSQPDLRTQPGAVHTALPLLGVVRLMGLDAVSVPVAAAFPHVFHTTHRMYLPASCVAPSETHVYAALHASAEPVPLLELPRDTASLHTLRPLVRGAVLPLYPPGLRGPSPEYGDPDEELERIVRRWSDR